MQIAVVANRKHWCGWFVTSYLRLHVFFLKRNILLALGPTCSHRKHSMKFSQQNNTTRENLFFLLQQCFCLIDLLLIPDSTKSGHPATPKARSFQALSLNLSCCIIIVMLASCKASCGAATSQLQRPRQGRRAGWDC